MGSGHATGLRPPAFPALLVRLHLQPRILPSLDRVLHQQGQVVTGKVVVGESRHAPEIVLVDVAEQPEHLQRLVRVEDVVENAGKRRSVVGEGRLADRRIARLEAEGVHDAVSGEVAVPRAAKVVMRVRHLAVRDEIVHARVGHRVEVAAQDHGNRNPVGVLARRSGLHRRVGHVAARVVVAVGEAVHGLVQGCWPLCVPLRKLGNLLHQNRNLDELDVFVHGVPEDVCRRDDEPRPGHSVFQEGHDGDVVAGHDSVEDVVLSLHVRPVDGRVGEIDHMLVEQDVPDPISLWFEGDGRATYLLFL